MKRRDFMVKSSFALAAMAASDLWLDSVVRGETMPTNPSALSTYFQVTKDEMNKLLVATLAKGADFADLFFEYRITSLLTFEEDKVKSARRGIISGVGIRAIKGDQVGYAFSEDLTMEKMMEAAGAAAAIANDPTARQRVKAISEMRPKNLYPVAELATSSELGKKLAFITEANEAAKAYSPKIVRVNAVFSDEVKHLAYANSEGVSWTDMQPVFVFSTSCIAEEGKRRETGYDSGGGRIGLEYFAKKRTAADIAKEAARLAVMNLKAEDAEAGLQTVVLGAGDSAVEI